MNVELKWSWCCNKFWVRRKQCLTTSWYWYRKLGHIYVFIFPPWSWMLITWFGSTWQKLDTLVLNIKIKKLLVYDNKHFIDIRNGIKIKVSSKFNPSMFIVKVPYLTDSAMGSSLLQKIKSGERPRPSSSRTLACVGLVLCSPKPEKMTFRSTLWILTCFNSQQITLWMPLEKSHFNTHYIWDHQ